MTHKRQKWRRRRARMHYLKHTRHLRSEPKAPATPPRKPSKTIDMWQWAALAAGMLKSVGRCMIQRVADSKTMLPLQREPYFQCTPSPNKSSKCHQKTFDLEPAASGLTETCVLGVHDRHTKPKQKAPHQGSSRQQRAFCHDRNSILCFLAVVAPNPGKK